MIRLWIIFAILAFAIHLSITGWRDLNGKERWALTKSVFYSIIVSLLAVTAMMFIVLIF